MSNELLNVLESLEREKGISRQVLIESVEAALVSAAKKVVHDKDKEIQVKIDLKSGSIRVFSEDKEIVSNEFSRIAAQTAKQVIFQKIREAERDVVYGEYIQRAGTIVNGTVYRFEKGSLLVDLGKTEGILPRKEMSPRDSYRQGDTIRAYVLEVSKTSKGPQIVLSRSHPGFVQRLFELEVPEVADKLVGIMSVSREAGDRAKISVWSQNEKIDCVGACVGIRGSRVKGVVKELQGEKIDIIRWSENVEEYVKAALSLAEVSSAKITHQEDKKVEVVVDDEQLSLAIGKNGQNVRLASKLTGWSIDIRSKKEIAKEKLEAIVPAIQDVVSVDAIEGVGPKTAEMLAQAGYKTLDDLSKVTEEDLLAIKGIGKKTAQKILAKVRELHGRASVSPSESASAELPQESRAEDLKEGAAGGEDSGKDGG